MPATPDRDTLRLRRPDWRTPAEAVALTRRELARRPRPTLADVRLTPADRALVSFRGRYPAVAERFHAGVLWSAAHAQPAGKPTRRPCGWDLARAWSRRYGGPALRVDQLGRLLLGDPCPSCQAALSWRPPAPPRPRVRPAARPRSTSTIKTSAKAPARSSTSGGSRSVRVPARALAAAAGHPAGGVTAVQAAYNRAAMRRLGMNPATAPHLTRAGRP
jgi:hypothetical protein